MRQTCAPFLILGFLKAIKSKIKAANENKRVIKGNPLPYPKGVKLK